MFECHITIRNDAARPYVRSVVENALWKFSAMEDDPVLGKGHYFYATQHYPTVTAALAGIADVSRHLEDNGLYIKRQKIEVDVFDAKFN